MHVNVHVKCPKTPCMHVANMHVESYCYGNMQQTICMHQHDTCMQHSCHMTHVTCMVFPVGPVHVLMIPHVLQFVGERVRHSQVMFNPELWYACMCIRMYIYVFTRASNFTRGMVSWFYDRNLPTIL